MIFMLIDMSLIFLVALMLEILLQKFWIQKMHRLKIEQVTKLYGPAWHEKTKVGTPSMGGVVFMPVFLAAMGAGCLLIPGMRSDWLYLLKITLYPLIGAAIGLLDDWLKHSRHSSEGLRSLQKLFLQVALTLPWALLVTDGPFYLLPGMELPRAAAVPLLLFFGVGFQNAVNVTDGLDGLAAGLVVFSLAGAFVVGLTVQTTGSESAYFITIAAGAGVALGFLWHNANPAMVFMGDVGAHFFAGLLLALCACSGTFVFIIPLGFIFGIEIISVAIQIVAIRGFKRKVFRMSPVHHHFEMLGWREMQVVTRFWLIHIVGMTVCMSALFIMGLMV